MRPKRPPEGVERPDPPPPPPRPHDLGLSEEEVKEQIEELTKGLAKVTVKKLVQHCLDEAQREFEKSEGRMFLLERAVVEAAVKAHAAYCWGDWSGDSDKSVDRMIEADDALYRATNALIAAREGA